MTRNGGGLADGVEPWLRKEMDDMCKRTSNDPLLQAFLRSYGLNLLEVPRENAAIGDVYAVEGGRVLPPGRIGDLVVPAPRLPRVRTERLAHLAGVLSDGVSVEAGMGLLEGFLTALGAGAVVGTVRAGFKTRSVHRLRFRIEDASRQYVDTTSLGRALIGCTLQAGHPLASARYRHFVTVGVVRTSSISVLTEGSSGQRADLDVSAHLVGEAGASVAIERSGHAELRYRGSSQLAIGVELIELDFAAGELRFKPQSGPLRTRGIDRAFVGAPDGDAFMRIG